MARPWGPYIGAKYPPGLILKNAQGEPTISLGLFLYVYCRKLLVMNNLFDNLHIRQGTLTVEQMAAISTIKMLERYHILKQEASHLATKAITLGLTFSERRRLDRSRTIVNSIRPRAKLLT